MCGKSAVCGGLNMLGEQLAVITQSNWKDIHESKCSGTHKR